MKIITSKKVNNGLIIIILIIILISILFNILYNIVDFEYVATALQINKYEIQSEQLKQATNYVGVCKAEDAVNVWANGLKLRNGAMQYITMTELLKVKYEEELDKNFPNWVTGMSSPWIDSYKITKTEKSNDNTYIYYIIFSTATSTGPSGNYNAKITVIKDDSFWRISNINIDKELYPYTGYNQ